MLTQNPPKYYYSTVQVTRTNQVRATGKAPNFGQAAHWLVGAANWLVNQRKIKEEMEKITPKIDELMSTDGGVLVAQYFMRPPKLSGNDDKAVFMSLGIVGYGCTPQDAAISYFQRLAMDEKYGTIRPYKGPGWTHETKLVWITMQ